MKEHSTKQRLKWWSSFTFASDKLTFHPQMAEDCGWTATIGGFYEVCIYTNKFVTRHEKTGLMYTNFTYSYYGMYFLYTLGFSESCIRLPMKSYINVGNFIRLLTI